MEWTFVEAASAAIALVRVNKYLAVNNLWQTDWTGSFNLTFLTAFAEICVWLRNTLTVDTKAVQDTTGRILAPVPPVSRPSLAR